MTIADKMNGLRTIAVSQRIFVQGAFVRALTCGRIVVRVGDRDFIGYPIASSI